MQKYLQNSQNNLKFEEKKYKYKNVCKILKRYFLIKGIYL